MKKNIFFLFIFLLGCQDNFYQDIEGDWISSEKNGEDILFLSINVQEKDDFNYQLDFNHFLLGDGNPISTWSKITTESQFKIKDSEIKIKKNNDNLILEIDKNVYTFVEQQEG